MAASASSMPTCSAERSQLPTPPIFASESCACCPRISRQRFSCSSSTGIGKFRQKNRGKVLCTLVLLLVISLFCLSIFLSLFFCLKSFSGNCRECDQFKADVGPKDGVQFGVAQQPPGVFLVFGAGIRQGRQDEGDPMRCQAHLLIAEQVLRRAHFNVGEEFSFAAEQVSDALFIKPQIQSCPPVPQNRCQNLPKPRSADWLVDPARVCDVKPDTIFAAESRVDELMLDAVLSAIDKFPVVEFGEKHI